MPPKNNHKISPEAIIWSDEFLKKYPNIYSEENRNALIEERNNDIKLMKKKKIFATPIEYNIKKFENIIQENNKINALLNQASSSKAYLCNRCGERNTKVTQIQTRSADEPMTTFIFCLTCKNQWSI